MPISLSFATTDGMEMAAESFHTDVGSDATAPPGTAASQSESMSEELFDTQGCGGEGEC